MISHQPPDYDCPFCRIQQGVYDDLNQPSDIVGDNDLAYARISPTWSPGNPGTALVIPKAHHENLYELPHDIGHAVWDLTQAVARAMRASYTCEGISTRQHNEPAGSQDVWHLHVHVFPRHDGDELYLRHRESRFAAPAERAPYATRLRAELSR